MWTMYGSFKEFDWSPKPNSTPLFCHNIFEKTIFNSLKPRIKMVLDGRLGSIFICNGRSCASSFKRRLYPHHFAQICFHLELISLKHPSIPSPLLNYFWDLQLIFLTLLGWSRWITVGNAVDFWINSFCCCTVHWVSEKNL